MIVSVAKLGFLGDSITYGYGSDTPFPALCGVNLAALLGSPVEVVNRGINGLTTVSWLPGNGYLEPAVAAFAGAGVTTVCIRLGTNDTRLNLTPATYRANLAAIAAHLNAVGCAVVLDYPTYFAPGAFGGLFTADEAARLLTYLPEIDALCDGYALFQGDTLGYPFFARNPVQLGDGVHPNTAGAVMLGALQAGRLYSLNGTGGNVPPPPPPPPTVLLRASFSAPDGTDLSTYVPEVGPALTTLAGTWLIEGNAVTLSALGGTRNFALATVDVADVTLSVTYTEGSGVDGPLCFNFVDEANHWFLWSTPANLYLYEQRAGVDTYHAFAALTLPAGTVHAYQVVTASERVLVSVDGMLVIDATIPGRKGQEATQHGLFLNSGSDGGGAKWADLQITT